MLVKLLITLGRGVLLGAVGFLFGRKRRADASATDEDGADQGVVPLLYVPQPRNTLSVSATTRAGVPMPLRRPAQVNRTPAKYIAPLPGEDGDGRLQLLPGRLVPAEGDVGQEIRFIKTQGINRFTFGRSQGPANTHVQLLARTASRMHAYMIIENGRWRIGNMSETNVVTVNGVALDTADADRWLEDGDRIELGEVGFIFRER
jgi:hypothetical protein